MRLKGLIGGFTTQWAASLGPEAAAAGLASPHDFQPYRGTFPGEVSQMWTGQCNYQVLP